MSTVNSYIYIDARMHYIEISLSYEESRENGDYIARCPELQLSDFGETQKQAINNLYEMIFTTLIRSLERGDLPKMLRKLGFRKTSVPAPEREYWGQKIEKTKDVLPLPDRGRCYKSPIELIS